MGHIAKAYHSILKKGVTVFEYEQYRNQHPHFGSIRPLRCVECGDPIIYNGGGPNMVAHFKHEPSVAGHSYCSLYTEGTESKTAESLVRKRLFKEEDIALNFELVYFYGKWKSFIVLPPFNSSEIQKNTLNNTKLTIASSYGLPTIQIPLNSQAFFSGERKRIELSKTGISSVKITVTGNSTNHKMSFDMECFLPNSQLYSSTISENTISIGPNASPKSIPPFACKKLGGKVFTGRHYLIFSRLGSSPLRQVHFGDAASVNKINLPFDQAFGYYAYDIIFNKVTNETRDFCDERGCELVEKDDLSIIWPPIKSVGDYKYYGSRQTKMFVLSQNDQKALDMEVLPTDKLYFKVININANSFYVNHRVINPEKTDIPFDNVDSNKFVPIEGFANYLLKKGVLLSRHSGGPLFFKKKHSVLSIKNVLERKITLSDNGTAVKFKEKTFLEAIRYSRELIPIGNIHLQPVFEKFANNEIVMNYLNMCIRTGTIKYEALKILMEA